jgi:hypothetical protein
MVVCGRGVLLFVAAGRRVVRLRHFCSACLFHLNVGINKSLADHKNFLSVCVVCEQSGKRSLSAHFFWMTAINNNNKAGDIIIIM